MRQKTCIPSPKPVEIRQSLASIQPLKDPATAEDLGFREVRHAKGLIHYRKLYSTLVWPFCCVY
jgi:hypothetical protein